MRRPAELDDADRNQRVISRGYAPGRLWEIDEAERWADERARERAAMRDAVRADDRLTSGDWLRAAFLVVCMGVLAWSVS